MRLENKEQLVKLIDDLEVNEGFDFKGYYKTAMNNDSELTFGVRKIDIIASDCIVFGGYGVPHSVFCLNCKMTDEIVDEILKSEGLKITDIEVLEGYEVW